MPSRADIVTFHDPPVPPGSTMYVPGVGPTGEVRVEEPDERWTGWYDDLAGRVLDLAAKPVVDIDLVVADAAHEAARAAGEHSMQYNARKEKVVREIYARAFAAAGLVD
ncbi:hypothetical protein [Nocardioides salarius]|uniref:hypothetical protein n=1 Tax=Nocardioides salarius TaxID=374513 RepID=UPI0030FCBC1E